MRTGGLAAAFLLLLAACATPARWEKSGADDERRDVDLATCASLARNELRSHDALARERPELPDAVGSGRSAVDRRLREADAYRRREALAADCMLAKGYRRSPAWPGRAE